MYRMPFGFEKQSASDQKGVDGLAGKLSSYLNKKAPTDGAKFESLQEGGTSRNPVATGLRDTGDKLGQWFGVKKPDSPEPDVEAGGTGLLSKFKTGREGSSSSADPKNLKGLNRIKAAVGMEVKEPTALDKMEDACNSCGLTYKQRLCAFGLCLAGGILMFALAAYTVPAILIGQGHKFVLFFCVANICVFGSTGFLVGPVKQFKTMCAPTRALAAIVYAVCMGLTIYAALKGKGGVALLFMIIMILSFIWYSLSYIPFARSMAWNFISTIIKS